MRQVTKLQGEVSSWKQESFLFGVATSKNGEVPDPFALLVEGAVDNVAIRGAASHRLDDVEVPRIVQPLFCSFDLI